MLTHEATASICWGAAGRLLKHWGHEFGEWEDLLPIARTALTEITRSAVERPDEMHDIWCDVLRADGWCYGPQRDTGRKHHPWMCQWGHLDEGSRLFFKMWRHIVIFIALEYPEGSDFALGLAPRRLPATEQSVRGSAPCRDGRGGPPAWAAHRRGGRSAPPTP